MMKDFISRRFLLLGGTTKAASTALFYYLADHPQICPSSMKETRFFLDRDYPLQARYRLADGLQKYAGYFQKCSMDSVLMEATPDYLYSRDAAEQVATTLPESRFLFVLRDPVDRLVSWYHFARQTGELDTGQSFQNFLDRQIAGEPEPGTPQVLRALEQGRYSRYLSRFFDRFGEERVKVLYFEEFCSAPEQFMEQICGFAGVSTGFYADYVFKPHNETVTTRNAKVHRRISLLARTLRGYTHRYEVLHRPLKKLRRSVDSFFQQPLAPRVELRLGSSTADFLRTYYLEEPTLLAGLCGQAPNWSLQLPDAIEEM
jgi:hypothetical protein